MDTTYLFVALIWSSVGLGFFIYGKKQKKIISLAGGVLLMGITYIVRSPMQLSLASLGIIAVIYLMRNMQ